MTITIFVVDHSKSRRRRCVRLLKSQRGVRVVGESESAADGFRLITELKPNVVLLDLDLPPESSQKLLPILRQQNPRMKVLLLSRRASRARILESLSYGAVGCINNRVLSSLLPKAIRAVNAGEAWVPRSLVSSVLNRVVLLHSLP